MMARIMEFFTESAKVFTNPDDFFYAKVDSNDYGGVLSLIFYSIVLGLVMGIATGDIVIAGILIVAFLILPVIHMFIHSIFTFVFARLLGGSGSFMNTFNLMSYSGVLNVLLIIAIALATLGFGVIVPIIFLVVLWKLVIQIIAVSEEHNLGYSKAFLSTTGISLIIMTIIVLIMGLI